MSSCRFHFAFVFQSGTIPKVRDTEWWGNTFNTGARFAPESQTDAEKDQPNALGRHTLEIEAVINRYYTVHIARVIVVMALISLTSLTAFCDDPEVTCLDRLSLAVTLLLTATA